MDETKQPIIFKIKIDGKKLAEILLNYLMVEGMITQRETKYFSEVSHEPGSSMVEFVVRL